jgi:uncharacterized membrane protein YqhA
MAERLVVALVVVFSVVALVLFDMVVFSEVVAALGVIVAIAKELGVIVELVGTVAI